MFECRKVADKAIFTNQALCAVAGVIKTLGRRNEFHPWPLQTLSM